MKDLKSKIQMIMNMLGMKKSLKDLNNKEMQEISNKYSEVFKSNLLEDFEKENKIKEDYTKAIEAISDGKGTSENTDLLSYINQLQSENKEKDEQIRKLGSVIEPDNPKQMEIKADVFTRQHSNTHLFDIENEFFSLSKRWNQLMVNRSMRELTAPEDKKVSLAFQRECEEFGVELSKRFQFLQSVGKLPKRGAAFTQTYTDLSNAGLGNQFVVMRQDALIAKILELPNIYDIFPRRYGIQDRELMTHAFFGEFSQPYQTGAVYKGDMELKPEMAYVDDAMFKTVFQSMKWLERQYLGYLNKEGSDPMKWSLIEWTLLQIATKLTMESYERRITGVYVAPVTNEPGHYLHASTGLFYTLLRYFHELKLMPFTERGFSTYDNTGTDMVDTVIAFYEKFKEVAPTLQENQFAMYLNANHRYWYKSQVRSKYGLQTDFTGPIDTLVPDTTMPIVWVPNLQNHKLIMITRPGNFQALENLPGEMFNIQFQPDMEAYKAWSVWKEGFAAEYVGKQFSSMEALISNSYALQEVFINLPNSELSANATSVDVSVAKNFWFVSAANSGSTTFTDFTNAVAGVGYILECGNITNATKTAKSGKFSNIDAWEPTAVGDYLMVTYDTTSSKFVELERCVGGLRTINKDKQPNIPGARD